MYKRQLLDLLRNRTARLHAPAIVTLRKGVGTPLFLFPGAGGNSVYFHALAQALPAHGPVIGVQAVGLDGDDAPHETVAAMAAHAVTHIRRVQATGPYLLAGHSLGGRVAFEVARRLEDADGQIALLAVLDTPAPLPGSEAAAPSARDAADDLAWLDEVREIIEVTTGRVLEIDLAALRALDNRDRIAAVAAQLTSSGLLHDGRLARGFIGVYQAAVRMSYEARGSIAAPIAVFRTSTDPAPPTWGWERLTTVGASAIDVPGAHISMLMPPHVTTLASRLGSVLSYITDPAGASTVV